MILAFFTSRSGIARGVLVTLLAWLVALLAACGGGGGDGGVGSSGTGVGAQYGGVSGYGSVFVEGTRYDESSGSVTVEGDPAAASASATLSDLNLGVQTELIFDAGDRAATIRVLAEVIGAVTSTTADGFVVAGQTVKLSPLAALPTVFDGFEDLSDIAIGDRLEVHGHRDTAGRVFATRVEHADALTANSTRVMGTVAALDTAARQFQIGALRIDYDNTTTLLPAGAVLASGARVAVFASGAPTGGRLLARTIRVDRFTHADNVSIRAGGVVRQFDSVTRRFRLAGVDIDPSAATYSNGSASDLADGAVVRVRGVAAGGLLRAQEIRFFRVSSDASIEITGVVADFSSAASFRIRNTQIDASDPAVVFVNGSASNLTDGALLQISGSVANGRLRVNRITFVTTEDSRTTGFLGTVSGYDAASGNFTLLGAALRLAPAATFRNSDGTAARRADFVNGLQVGVGGRFVSGVFVVDTVIIRVAGQGVPVSFSGLAYRIDLAARTFRLNQTVVRWNTSTIIDGTLTDLRLGRIVRVDGFWLGGEVTATRLTLR